MAITTAVIVAGAEAGAGYAALDVAAGLTLAHVAAGAAMVGGLASAIGAATGHAGLSKFGSIVGMVGGVASVGTLLSNIGTNAAGSVADASISDAAQQTMASTDAATNPANLSGTAATQSTTDATQAATQTGGAGAGATPSPVTPQAGVQSSPLAPLDQGTPAEQAAVESAAPGAQAAQSAQIANAPSSGIINSAQQGATDAMGPLAQQLPPGAATQAAQQATNFGAPTIASGATSTAPMAAGGAVTNDAAGGVGQSLWSQFKDLPLKDQMSMLQVGSGVVGGIAKYIAPSPTEKAQIALQNAQTAALKQQQGIIASHNAGITGQGSFAPTNPNGTPAAGATGYTPPVSTSPANPYSINNNPYAAPTGLIQGAQGA